MQYRKFLLSVLAAASLLPQAAQAASFDCRHAASKMEQLVCSDAALSRLDENLAVSYARALSASGDPAALKDQQRDWLADTARHCDSAACLKEAYAQRIRQLDAVGVGPAATLSPFEACRLVADTYSSTGSPAFEFVAPTAPPPKPEDIRRIFGEVSALWRNVEYWHLDFDNDGTLDHLAISADGTATGISGHFISGRGKKEMRDLADAGSGNLELSVITVAERHYILSSVDGRLTKMWYAGAGKGFVPVCAFKALRAETELNEGRKNPLCSKIQPGSIAYVAYSGKHALGDLGKQRLSPMKAEDGMARVDINNDGKPENVVRLNYSAAGSGCINTAVAVTDEAGASIPDTPLNNRLREDLASGCGLDVNVFELGGKAYVDVKDANNGHAIYFIKAAKADKICEFSERVYYQAVEAGQ